MDCHVTPNYASLPISGLLMATTHLLKKYATIIGCLATTLWSFDGVMFSELNAIPTFEVLTVVCAAAFVFALIRLTITKRWYVLKQPWYVWAIVAIGIYGNNVCYVVALKYAPPEQAILIYYTWPIFVSILGSMINRQKNNGYTYLSIMLGFAAISIVHIKHHTFVFETKFIVGYIGAFLVALIWSSYIVVSRKIQSIPLEMVGIIFGFGMICSAGIHYAIHEPMQLPNFNQTTLLCAIGLFSFGIAYQAWQIGINDGNINLLKILSYSSPVLSILWLILFGFSTFSMNLIIACGLIVLSISIAGWQEKKRGKTVDIGTTEMTP